MFCGKGNTGQIHRRAIPALESHGIGISQYKSFARNGIITSQHQTERSQIIELNIGLAHETIFLNNNTITLNDTIHIQRWQ